MKFVSRFAPSPTGFLHIGNLRTAIFNYMVTKKNDGKFILRIDDTDKDRSHQHFIDQIKSDLEWLGLEWDQLEMQSDRIDLYESLAKRLRESGRLYECFETPAELELKRKKLLNMGKPPVYDRSALKLTDLDLKKLRSDKPSHWRFKLNRQRVDWRDGILGPISIDCASVSDPVLIRGDGQFLYTLASVCDDIDMSINYVIRGADHVTNTGTQIQMIALLNEAIPTFSHHSLLTGSKGEPLSKRLGKLSLKDMRENGIEARALFSFMATLGSSNPIDLNVKIADQIKSFETTNFGSAPTKFDYEILKNVSAKYLNKSNYSDISRYLSTSGVPNDIAPDFWEMARENIENRFDIRGLWELCVNGVDPLISPEDVDFVQTSVKFLPQRPWDKTTWKDWTDTLKASTGRKGKNLYLPLRKALTGKESGPDMSKLLPLLQTIRLLN